MISKSVFLIGLTALIATSSEAQLPNLAFLDILNKMDFLNKPLDWLLFDVIPRLIDQRPSSELPDRKIFKEYLMKDESNDDASHLSVVSIQSN